MPKVTLIISAIDGFSATIRRAYSSVAGVVKSVGATAAKGVAATGVALAALAAAGARMVSAWQLAAAADARLVSVLRQTGGAAGYTAGELRAMAGDLQLLTGFSDDAVKGVMALLAAQRTIRGDEYRRATVAALDMTEALTRSGQSAGDIEERAKQLAMALASPAEGMSRLTRAGIVFTDAQRRQAREMQAAGDIAGAQRLILSAVEEAYGGVASSQNAAVKGMRLLSETIGDAQERLGEAIASSGTFAEILARLQAAAESVITSGRVDLWAARIESALRAMIPVVSTVAGWFGKLTGGVRAVGAFTGSMLGGSDMGAAWQAAKDAPADAAKAEADAIAEMVRQRQEAQRKQESAEAAAVAAQRRRIREREMAEIGDRAQVAAEALDKLNLTAVVTVRASTDAASIDAALAEVGAKAVALYADLADAADEARAAQKAALAELGTAEEAAEAARLAVEDLSSSGIADMDALRRKAEETAAAVGKPRTVTTADVERAIRADAEAAVARQMRAEGRRIGDTGPKPRPIGDVQTGMDWMVPGRREAEYMAEHARRVQAMVDETTAEQRLARARAMNARLREPADNRAAKAAQAQAELAKAEESERARIAAIKAQEVARGEAMARAESAAARQAKARVREQQLDGVIKQAEEFKRKLDEATRKRRIEIDVADITRQIEDLQRQARAVMRLDIVDPRQEAAGFAERGEEQKRIAEETAADDARQRRLEEQQALAKRGLAPRLSKKGEEWLRNRQEWQAAQAQADDFSDQAAALEARRDMVQDQQLEELRGIHKTLAENLKIGEL